jgi:hypothetical protein
MKPFVNEIPEPEMIVKAINQTEEWIEARIFDPNGIPFDEIVATGPEEWHESKALFACGHGSTSQMFFRCTVLGSVSGNETWQQTDSPGRFNRIYL